MRSLPSWIEDWTLHSFGYNNSSTELPVCANDVNKYFKFKFLRRINIDCGNQKKKKITCIMLQSFFESTCVIRISCMREWCHKKLLYVDISLL